MGHRGTFPPLLQVAGHGGHREWKISKQETGQTVLTITKALTETTNCTLRAKKVEGHDHSFFRRFAPDWCPSPAFKFVPAPLYEQA